MILNDPVTRISRLRQYSKLNMSLTVSYMIDRYLI